VVPVVARQLAEQHVAVVVVAAQEAKLVVGNHQHSWLE
jgi:hypothetical protein